jgi:plasmid stabilization system protein ParE
MTDSGIRVVGGRRLRSTLRSAEGDLEDLKAANAAAAAIVAAYATATAPRRTGRLAGTIRGNRAAGRARVSAGYASVPYAGPIHWGWPARNIPAQPWISRAAQTTEPRWLPAYQRDIERVLTHVKGA